MVGRLLWVRTQDGKTGFVNLQGHEQIKPQFKKALDFSEGLAAVQSGKLWGVIDKAGRWILKPTYDDIESFYRGRAAVRLKNKYATIDKTGRIRR